MNTPVAILGIVGLQSFKYSKLDPGSVPVFLHGSDDFDGHQLVPFTIPSFDNLAECPLPQEV